MAGKTVTEPAGTTDKAWALVPATCRDLADPQRDLPRIARDQALMAQIESAVRSVPTRHDLHLGDARQMDFLTPESVHLVVTSPPYWTLREYRETPLQSRTWGIRRSVLVPQVGIPFRPRVLVSLAVHTSSK